MTSSEDVPANPGAESALPRLRLLKAVVQFVFVVDDGEILTERVADPVVVPASSWPEWAISEYPRLLAQLEEEVRQET